MKNRLSALVLSIIGAIILLCNITGTARTQSITKAAHLAGSWYPVDYRSSVNNYLDLAKKHCFIPAPAADVRAIVVPHAGHTYSGFAAAAGYAALMPAKGKKNQSIKRVIILATDHHGMVDGVALPPFDAYKLPATTLKVDLAGCKELQKNELFAVHPSAFNTEHSMEIQLPFIERSIAKPVIIPLLVGSMDEATCQAAAQHLATIIDERTLIIASSDLLHVGSNYQYEPFATNIFDNIRARDAEIIERLLRGNDISFTSYLAGTNATVCGRFVLSLLLKLLKTDSLKNLHPNLACYYTSPQITTYGLTDPGVMLRSYVSDELMGSSVSYAAIAYTTSKPSTAQPHFLTGYEQQALLRSARARLHALFAKEPVDERFLTPIRSFGVMQHVGSFVTLKTTRHKALRGCIGRITSDEPLYAITLALTRSAAFEDHRFNPVEQHELEDITIEISILSKARPVNSYRDIKLGKQGIILHGPATIPMAQALFLPQVASEQRWTREQTLQHLALKAGLDAEMWAACRYEVFEGHEFSE